MGTGIFARCLCLALLCPLGKAAASDNVGINVVKDLLDQLWDYQSGKAGDKKHVGFDLPETLVNQYIAYLIDGKIRLGAKSASIKISGKNRVTVSCDLDLLQIKAWEPDVIKPGSPLAGKNDLPVSAIANVEITNGTAKISILSIGDAEGLATQSTLQELLQVVASNQPEHFDLDQPIKLPFNLSISIADGVFYGKTPGRAH